MQVISLSDRMKNYEDIFRYKLIPRMPVIIRLDGKAFHTYTKQFKSKEQPFSNAILSVMQDITKRLCNEIQGCVCGYTQSDEISLLLIDYTNLNTNAWFNGNIQKISSVTASMATAYFNDCITAYDNKLGERPSLAFFDCRCFNLSKEEVSNYFIWRQQDAIRNSKQSFCYSYYSQKQVQNKNTDELIAMVKKDFNVDWYDLPQSLLWGSFYSKISDWDFVDFKMNRHLIDILVYLEQ